MSFIVLYIINNLIIILIYSYTINVIHVICYIICSNSLQFIWKTAMGPMGILKGFIEFIHLQAEYDQSQAESKVRFGLQEFGLVSGRPCTKLDE